MTKSFIKKTLDLLPKNAPALQKKLLEKFGETIPAEDLKDFDTELFLNMVESHWTLSKDRKDGGPKLAIHSPVTTTGAQRKTIIDIVSDDLAFVVDSIAAEINKHNLLIDLLIHPLLYVTKNSKGEVTDIKSHFDSEEDIRQSHIHIHIKEILSEEDLKNLETGLHESLNDVFMANKDWKALLERLKEAKEELATARTKNSLKEVEQHCAFLSYLYDNNFTILGYREYKFIEKAGNLESQTVKGSGLGLLHDDLTPAYINEDQEGLPRNLQELRRNLPPVSISKTNRISTVHRRVPMDAIAIKTYDMEGNVTGEKLFIGLFTSVTYSRSVSDVPYLREKVEEVIELSGFMPGSHDYKALRHILEKYPRDELFQIDKQDLLTICIDILRLHERQKISLFVRQDPFGRYISCLVYVPRDRFGTDLRHIMIDILEEELNGKCSNFYTTLDDSVFARIMFIINLNDKAPTELNIKKIEKRLRIAGQTWQEKFFCALTDSINNEEEITYLTLKYGEAFPISYTSRYEEKNAIFDIAKIEKALNENRIQLDLYCPDDIDAGFLRFKIYSPDAPVTLSDVMPILEHMGVRAISELPFEITPKDRENSIWIHDFLLEIPHKNGAILIEDVKSHFEEAFTKIWYNEMESGGLNKLVLCARMNWRDITILRTYLRYLRQIRYPFSQPYIRCALTENPLLSLLITDLFKILHDPSRQDNVEQDTQECLAAIEKELEQVESLDQDRILRSMTAIIKATLRTNFYQTLNDGAPKSYLSIKLDSKAIEDMPQPRPYREIFVYSPRVEAIHLRGDKIARGGLRWSDRQEDYRTEVLGLMKAQMVKNSLIVPMGSKGGFVVKSKMTDRKAFFDEGMECYKTFIRGMLDITDNLNGNKVVPPKNVVRRDNDDPYLVVAADKGTSTFSDTANALAQEYGFWLDDAFASGGSAGYDHKKMGITAKGAWESVKAHFRQLGHNIQEKPFDVVGIGDMSGDVFGNGMLLSKHIRLIGAFNHLHIVCDPDPDPAISYKERERLFKKVAGWDQYNEKKLSKGGRIYSRGDKVLHLTPEIKKCFNLNKDKVSPIELISAILKSRCNLLWFGGIGTYIKSKDETHAQVGDKTNDALRVDASEIRAHVIGEGANLAITQLGRIEFSKAGGRINTDFLDNSAGVNSSDKEVNIKILLRDLMARKGNDMDLKARNALLEKMTDEVADQVLWNNYQQAQAISLIESRASKSLQIHEEFIQDLEREEGLSREIEGLPNVKAVQKRLKLGKGLTRPELCILLSYSKISFTKDLLSSNIPDSPEMQGWLIDYFPELLRKKYEEEIKNHRLKREIIATAMANSLINRMGPTFIKSRMKKTSATCADIARAYIIVREAYQLRPLWDQIEALDNKVPAEVQLSAMREIASLSEHVITWFLTRTGRELDIGEDIKHFSKGIKKLHNHIDDIATDDLKTAIKQRTQKAEQDGMSHDLAYQIALMPVISSACDIIRISLEQNTNLLTTARVYFELGKHFRLNWLRQQARFITSEDPWNTEAISGIIDQLYSCQAGLTVHILKNTGPKNHKKNIVEKWLKDHKYQISQITPLFTKIKQASSIELSMLVIVEQRMRNLYGG